MWSQNFPTQTCLQLWSHEYLYVLSKMWYCPYSKHKSAIGFRITNVGLTIEAQWSQYRVWVYPITWIDTRVENLTRPSSVSFSDALFPLRPFVISLVDSPPLCLADNPSSKCIYKNKQKNTITNKNRVRETSLLQLIYS